MPARGDHSLRGGGLVLRSTWAWRGTEAGVWVAAPGGASEGARSGSGAVQVTFHGIGGPAGDELDGHVLEQLARVG